MVQGILQIGLREDIEVGGISNLTRHPLLEPVLAWARTEEAIRAVVITGSLARRDASTDQWSDLDAQIITCDIRRYSADDSWLDALGDVWIRFPLHEDVPYRLVWFAGGIKVDFQFLTVESIHDMRECGSLSDEYKRGYLVALDKDDLYRDLPPSPHLFPQPGAPSAEQVHSIINEFWFEAIHVAQFIRRREFWVVKFRDWTMKSDLLQLLDWHARASANQEINTWLLGKRIHEWTDDATYKSITQIWSGWDALALWQGLLQQIELFRRLSIELSQALDYVYHDATYRQIEAYIRSLQAADDLD